MGSRLRTALLGISADMSDENVGKFFIERHILVHVQNFRDKFNTFCLMLEKLYSVVAGECDLDNLDAPSN